MSSSGPLFTNSHNQNIDLIIKYLNPLFPIRLVISGGEPLAYPYLLDTLAKLKHSGNVIILSTNACISIKNEPKILDYLDWIDISMHGNNPAEYKNLRSYDCFGAVIENILQIKNTNPKLRLAANFLLHKGNLDTLDAAFNMYKKLGISKVRIANISKQGRARNCGLNPISTDNEYEHVFRIIKKHQSHFKMIVPPIRLKKKSFQLGYFVIDHDNSILLGERTYWFPSDTSEILKQMQNHFPEHLYLFESIEDY